MSIELYNELGKLMKVIFNVVDLKIINDIYYIKSEEEGFLLIIILIVKKLELKKFVYLMNK